MEWKPIETAPKDGRDVDVCFFERIGPLEHRYERITNVHWDSKKECWVEWADNGFERWSFHPMKPQPTHWMPLPEPPK